MTSYCSIGLDTLPLGWSGRILLIRLDMIGDHVLSTAFTTSLRKRFPLAYIALACPQYIANFLGASGIYDEFIAGSTEEIAAKLASVERFDMTICPRPDRDLWGGYQLALQSGAPMRVGFDHGGRPFHSTDALGPDIYFTHWIEVRKDLHEVEKMRSLFSLFHNGASGTYEFLSPNVALSIDARGEARHFLRRSDVCPHYVALGVSASHKRRVWPVANFLPVADALIDQGLKCIVVGGNDAVEAAEFLTELRPQQLISAVGEISLLACAAVLSAAKLYIGMDTGLMHIAASFGVPVVEISCHPESGIREHGNAPERFGPFATRSIVLRPKEALAPCPTYGCEANDSHCIRAVNPEKVIAAVQQLLSFRCKNPPEARTDSP